MRHLLAIISLLMTFNTMGFSQDSVGNKRSIFLNGVQLEKPNYNFQWTLKISDIPAKEFINYQVDKNFIGVWTHIKFDSVFFNEFLFKQVIIKVTKKKSDDKFKMSEFVGIVDSETLDKMSTFFNYNWKGWIIYPKENPLYKFRLFKTKNKNEGAIVIDRF